MTFHDFAVTETATVLQRQLSRQSAASIQSLGGVREALDAAARALGTLQPDDSDVLELAARLSAAAEADVRRAREEADEFRTALARADAESAAMRTELAAADERIQAANRDLDATLEAHATLERALRETRAELSEARQSAQDAESRAAADRTAAEASGHELTELRARLEQETARTQALHEEIARLENSLRARTADVQAPQPAAAASDGEALRAEVDRMISLFDASARAVSEMAAASGSSELLAELVKRLSLQFSRVVLFRVKANALEGEHQIGFDDGTDISKLVLPLTVDSMIRRALDTGTVQSLAGADVAVRSGTPFGGNPSSAVALPIVLQGKTLAVVYADDSEMPDDARGPAVHESSVGYARLLVGQVVVLLVRHTHELKTLAELTQYAATLVQEAREMYQADVDAGKNTEIVRSRLKDNIECASQLYAYRASMEGTAAAKLLDDQIAAELQADTPFARDLAAIVRQMTAGDVQLTAEAS